MYRILTILLAASLSSTLFAQQHVHTDHKCGYVDAVTARDAQHPGYEAAVDQLYQEMLQVAADKRARNEARQMVYTIPVVVHIVSTDAASDIPDSVVYSQIDVLNEDYRRTNADAALTRPDFMPVAGDAMIEFELATVDPSGNPTTGITRTVGSPGFLGFSTSPFDNSVKHSADGGVDAWDTETYLNIWVCDMSFPGIGPAVLGYAYPPAGLANWPAGSNAPESFDEGVVVHYQVFGRNNPTNTGAPLNIVDRGRTTTHEVGHFLGLRHVWGDGDCTEDDGVADTPLADDNAAQVCDWTKNSCVDSPVDLPDQIENFMDYAADSCMNMFTQQQIDIMRAVLEGPRAPLVGLVSSNTQVQSLAVSVYPNPASTELMITLADLDGATLVMSNTLGQTVLSQELTSRQETVSLAGLDNGLYFVRLTSGEKSSTVRVMVSK